MYAWHRSQAPFVRMCSLQAVPPIALKEEEESRSMLDIKETRHNDTALSRRLLRPKSLNSGSRYM